MAPALEETGATVRNRGIGLQTCLHGGWGRWVQTPQRDHGGVEAAITNRTHGNIPRHRAEARDNGG
jgi:hypothetical protein